MSLTKNNRLGAGDGISLPVQAHKRRLPVPSSRKFATRGVAPNAAIKQKLQNALDELRTPIDSPLKRRSLSMAEINSADYKNRRKSLDCERSAHLASKGAANSEERRRAAAGRRVCHQLVLNAWRRRRSDLATAAESRDRLQIETNQLNLQVEVLQKMRQFEVQRRINTNNENKKLLSELEEVKQTNSNLLNNVKDLQEKLDVAESNINQINIAMMNERNLNFTLRVDIKRTNDELNNEKKIVNRLKEEVQRLMKEITNYETLQLDHQAQCQQYEQDVHTSEEKYLDSLEECKRLEVKLSETKRQNENLLQEQKSLNEALTSARSKNEKLELKLVDLKKQLSTHRMLKKRNQEENEELRSEIERVKGDFKAQNERQWWLKTGEFLFDKFTLCAYVLFPAMPRRFPTEHLLVLDSSIALGSL